MGVKLFFAKQAIRFMRKKTIPFLDRPLVLRRGMERISKQLKPNPDAQIQSVQIEHIPAKWFKPQTPVENTAILYVHGGGFVMGSVNTHLSLTSEIAVKANISVLSIDYRLAPEHPYPAGLEDVLTSYQFLIDEGFSNVVMVGDSAGGCLILSALLKLKEMDKRQPKCAVLLSPMTDLTLKSPSLEVNRKNDPMLQKEDFEAVISWYAPNMEHSNPYMSPLLGELSGLCPLLFQVGDIEVLLDDSKRFNEKAKNSGTDSTISIWPGAFHVWQMSHSLLDEGRKAILEICDFIHEKLKED